MADLARLTDAFYIGGTKNGALMGEALVISNPALQGDFFRIKKQLGAVLAKGWLLGVQFEALLKDGLYFEMARHANAMAARLQAGLKALGWTLWVDSPPTRSLPWWTPPPRPGWTPFAPMRNGVPPRSRGTPSSALSPVSPPPRRT